MRKDKLITINSKTSKVFVENAVLGVDNENLQGNLIFSFDDEFVDGTARLEIEIKGSKSYAMMTKTEETYILPIKSFLTKEGRVNMQVVITEGTDVEEIPIFKSNVFYLVVNSSINAEIEQPDEYPQWIDIANEKLNELDESIAEANNLDLEVSKSGTTATVTITKKDGSTKEVDIEDGVAGKDGKDGSDGKDAKINGVNTLTLEAGDNIELEQEGSTLTISATGGGGGTSNYNDLSNKPKINNVELSGNKTTSDLNINYNDLTNKPTIPVVPTNVSAFTNDAGYTTNTGTITSVKMNGTTISSSGEADLGTVITDISSKQDTIDSSHKLSSDLVDDTNAINLFVNSSEKTTWNGKQDTLVSGTNIKTINSTTLLGSGNFDIDGVKDAKTTNLDKFWSGTLSEYNALVSNNQIDSNTFYNITDDYSNNGLPSSGTTGQVLAKASNSDYDTEWISQHSFSHETWTFTLEDDSTVDKEVALW